MMKPYVIIGSGEAAKKAIQTLHEKGIPKERIIWLLNKDAINFGGDVVNELLLAELLNEFRRVRAQHSRAHELEIDEAALRFQIIKRLRGLYEAQMAQYNALSGEVEIKTGRVKLLEGDAVEVTPADGGGAAQKIPYEKVLVATLGESLWPEIIKPIATEKTVWNTQRALSNLLSEKPVFPEKIAIIGTTWNAIKWAQIYARFGVQVVLILPESRQFDIFTENRSRAMIEALLEDKIAIVTDAKLSAIKHEEPYYQFACEGNFSQNQGEGVVKSASGDLSGELSSVTHILCCETPVSFANKLLPAPLEMVADKKLHLKGKENIYLAGSAFYAIEDSPLLSFFEKSTLAGVTGEHAALNMLAEGVAQIDFQVPAVPLSNCTDPEYAKVGVTEKSARDQFVGIKKIEAFILKLRQDNLPIFSVNSADQAGIYNGCYVKLVTEVEEGADGEKQYHFIGVEMLAPNASLAIQVATPFVNDHVRVLDFFQHMMICPSIPEALKLCAKGCPEVQKHLKLQPEKKPSPRTMEEKPVVIIGGGLAGRSAALHLAKLGRRVILVNNDDGDAYVETLASKRALFTARRGRHTASVFRTVSRANLDSARSPSPADDRETPLHLWQRTSESLQELIGRENRKNREELRKAGVELIKGRGMLKDAHTVKIVREKEKNLEIEASQVVLATGGTPRLPGPYKNLYEQHKKDGCWVSTDALKEGKLPTSVIIIGGGVIGIEFAQAWRRLGVKVTIISRGKLLDYAEPEASDAISKILSDEGVRVFTGVEVEKAEYKEGPEEQRFCCKIKGGEEEISASHMLIACGRAPNAENLFELDSPLKAQLLDQWKRVIVNDSLQTPLSHIYAAGCSTTKDMPDLVTTAAEVGELIARNLSAEEQETPHVFPVPGAVFIDPEFGSVGLKEGDIKEGRVESHTFDITKKSLPMMFVDSPEVPDGCFLKLVTKDDVVVGATMVSPRASIVIQFATYFIRNQKTILDMYNTAYLRPNIAEAFHCCASEFSQVKNRFIAKKAAAEDFSPAAAVSAQRGYGAGGGIESVNTVPMRPVLAM